MKNTNDFLNLYKEYETLLRDQGIDVKDYEEQQNDVTQARLRMCRLFRNYLSHQNDPGFLEVSEQMVKFLENILLQFNDVFVKQRMKAPAKTLVQNDEKCLDVFNRFAKIGTLEVVVQGSSGYELVSLIAIASGLSVDKRTKIADIKRLKCAPIYASPMSKLAMIPSQRTIICTEDGTKNGKLLGIIYPKQF